MVPPAKHAASPVRTHAPAAAKARPLAFKALLMKEGATKGAMKGAAPKPASPPPPQAALPKTSAAKPDGKPIRKDEPHEEKPKERPAKEIDPLDPAARWSAQLAPPMASTSAAAKTEEVTQRSRVSLEELIPQVVRRIAWGGDRTKGAVQIELTSGDKVTVHAEGRRVRVEVDGNAALEKKIESRLRAAGIEVEGVR